MILILDFYVDEPACFGVPPYLSPYCRYIAGALVFNGIDEERIDYLTVDLWRLNQKKLFKDYEIIFLIAGTTVPGKYLGGKIGTLKEIYEFLDIIRKDSPKTKVIIGGPVRYADSDIKKQIISRGGYLISGDIEKYADLISKNQNISANFNKIFNDSRYQIFPMKRTYDELDEYAHLGAFLTQKHPNFPYLINEIETYRGCTREVFCSFCTEAFYGKPKFRKLEGILLEIKFLYLYGNRYFRLGRQADLMTYQPHMDEFRKSFPRPNPQSLYKLYRGIRNIAPEIKLLHLDNINPGLIATYPEESKEILKIITEFNTPGDTAAMGIESVDPIVIRENDLKCSEEEAMFAIELVNQYGAKRVEGIPVLLPGLNFIHGLKGETEKTFELNYKFLRKILDRGLLIRRINIRQSILFQRTKLGNYFKTKRNIKSIEKIHNRFLYYRDKIRKEIDHELLKRNFPMHTIIREVILEQQNLGYYLGRPLGSYPITVKIPKDDKKAQSAYQKKIPLNCEVINWEERSVIGLSYPVDYSNLGLKAIESISGLGKKQAYEIFINSRKFVSH